MSNVGQLGGINPTLPSGWYKPAKCWWFIIALPALVSNGDSKFK
jgi:hypothetical protein